MKVLSTIMPDEVLVTVKSLPLSLVTPSGNTVSLSDLIHVIPGEETPIAVQLRETELGMTTETEVTGFTVMLGITAKQNIKIKIMQ